MAAVLVVRAASRALHALRVLDLATDEGFDFPAAAPGAGAQLISSLCLGFAHNFPLAALRASFDPAGLALPGSRERDRSPEARGLAGGNRGSPLSVSR